MIEYNDWQETILETPATSLEGHRIKTQELLVNMGPQHPSTHGVLRVVAHVDGEVILDVVPHIGYLHRGTEKLAERRAYPQVIPLMDRFDYLAAMFNGEVWCMAVEKLMGLEVPPRAQYIRMMVMELNRIASHLVWLGTFGLDLGAMSVFLYAFRDRESILDLFEKICGARLTYSYQRIGGVPWDVPKGWTEEVLEFCKYLPPRLDEMDALLTGNEIFLVRTQGIGILPKEEAIDYGVTGPMLRASGVPFDVRRAEPYLQYDQVEFEIPYQTTGDVLARYLVRLEEMRQSVHILEQCVAQLPEGPVMAKVPRTIKPPAGECYVRIESPRGALGVYLVSDGSTNPLRFHLRPPSFINLQPLPIMSRGWKIGDFIAILGSVDIVLGEVDR